VPYTHRASRHAWTEALKERVGPDGRGTQADRHRAYQSNTLDSVSSPSVPFPSQSRIARIAVTALDRITTGFANLVRSAGGRIEELSVADLKVKLRAGIDAGNWPQNGDAIFAALTESGRPVMLAVDDLPILKPTLPTAPQDPLFRKA